MSKDYPIALFPSFGQIETSPSGKKSTGSRTRDDLETTAHFSVDVGGRSDHVCKDMKASWLPPTQINASHRVGSYLSSIGSVQRRRELCVLL